jgi:formylglycine-generating enzyme required for sulfatase activity
LAVCGQAQDLKTYKGIYEKNSEEVRSGFQPKFDGLQQQYQKSLEALKAGAQSRGDFKKTSAASDEIERFLKAKSLPATPDESAIPEIKAFQSAYVKQYNRLETDMTAQLGALTTKYEQALGRFLIELTKAGKMGEAKAVADEQATAQAAIKGYAETLAALKGPAAANATVGVVWPIPGVAAGEPTGKKDLYLVIDLSHGPKAAKGYPITYLAEVPKGGWKDEYKTDKLVLRKIEPGTFTMGSPEGELGRIYNETQHEVTLTKAFYIGVFEVTQKQWERVMGDWPSYFNNSKCRDERPVENVRYNDIRGMRDGANWPATNSVDAASFMGRLRARTGNMFDLPTEAQWEYACRAGTDTALNTGKNLTDKETCPNMAEAGRYKGNAGNCAQNGDTRTGTAKAGSYPPNAWGLYDLHGNVWERCLDWCGTYPGTESDPKGAATDSLRVIRGGGWTDYAGNCRSAARGGDYPDYRLIYIGFRVALLPGQ